MTQSVDTLKEAGPTLQFHTQLSTTVKAQEAMKKARKQDMILLLHKSVPFFLNLTNPTKTDQITL